MITHRMLYLQKVSAKTKDCLSSGKFIQSIITVRTIDICYPFSLLAVVWIFAKMTTTITTQILYTQLMHSYKLIQEIRKRRQSLRKIESNHVLLKLLFV